MSERAAREDVESGRTDTSRISKGERDWIVLSQAIGATRAGRSSRPQRTFTEKAMRSRETCASCGKTDCA